MESKVNEEILSWLMKNRDEKYREFHCSLTPGCGYVYGVRLPMLREKAKTLAKGDYHQYLKNATSDSYEEIMLQGLTIGYLKVSLKECLSYLTDFLPKVHNWAVCDSLCNTLKLARKEPDLMWNFLQPYIKSDEEFEIRFALVMYLSHYLDSSYLATILKQITTLHHDGYYVKMAAAWCLAEAYLRDPQQVIYILKEGKLDTFTNNKAIQKMRESYRISPKDKEMLNQWRRKG